MTAVRPKRQAVRYALLLVEAKLLGLDGLVNAYSTVRAPNSLHIAYVTNVIARKRAQK